ncbi:hypothetical protein MKW98_004117 [Papaver atlanticum]|uniref:Uncharacterized protein n=1 Tax=Papaver atlanticum TaxID=357466 RepID=A0AAD4XLS2_9MAGN|nr:hypothetical protein MKW98_004117 [Papaver atlanticum]
MSSISKSVDRFSKSVVGFLSWLVEFIARDAIDKFEKELQKELFLAEIEIENKELESLGVLSLTQRKNPSWKFSAAVVLDLSNKLISLFKPGGPFLASASIVRVSAASQPKASFEDSTRPERDTGWAVPF